MRRRSLRQCRNAMNSTAPSTRTELVCPSCNLSVSSSTSSTNNDVVTPKEYSDHVEECLATRTMTNSDLLDLEADDDDIDVDSVFSLETYTWAGQERVRATSLVEGGLRGPGFVSITRGDESEELNILDVDDEEEENSSHSEQYQETDLIFPKSESDGADEGEEEVNLNSRNDENIDDDAAAEEIDPKQFSNVKHLVDKSPSKNSPKDATSEIIKELKDENSRLRETSMCNICMDSYNTPLVSKKCWHVSCEECWMRALGAKKLCPQCKIIIQPKDLRRIYL